MLHTGSVTSLAQSILTTHTAAAGAQSREQWTSTSPGTPERVLLPSTLPSRLGAWPGSDSITH